MTGNNNTNKAAMETRRAPRQRPVRADRATVLIPSNSAATTQTRLRISSICYVILLHENKPHMKERPTKPATRSGWPTGYLYDTGPKNDLQHETDECANCFSRGAEYIKSRQNSGFRLGEINARPPFDQNRETQYDQRVGGWRTAYCVISSGHSETLHVASGFQSNPDA